MKNILLVDDEKFILCILSERLKLSGANLNVLTAENGKKAVETLESTPVDLLITDLRMPEMDGFELLAYMAERHPGIPAIVTTAFIDRGIYERRCVLGVNHYITKPFTFEELFEKILACRSVTFTQLMPGAHQAN